MSDTMRGKKNIQRWASFNLTDPAEKPGSGRPFNQGTLNYFSSYNPERVAGIDEAGRGCFAGPVVAAAVILPKRYSLPGLADSKTLPETVRDSLAIDIGVQAVTWGVGYAWPQEIDHSNILQATLKAMSRAVAAMQIPPEALLIDGDKLIPADYLSRYRKGREYAQRCVIDGDALIPAVSAASILAKSFRDRLMHKFDLRYPGYGFAVHKGYGTVQHRAALAQLGPCRLHRLSFHGVLTQSAPQQEQGLLW